MFLRNKIRCNNKHHYNQANGSSLRLDSTKIRRMSLTLNILGKFSADDILIFFLFFLENRILYFMQIVSRGDNLHEMSNPVFLEK